MILFFSNDQQNIIAVQVKESLPNESVNALKWLFGDAGEVPEELLHGYFV